ncbi:MAG: aminoacyl-tRNA hydrolase [Acidimicrobiales bacterium]|jgi:PTH1 family peptidyl-tRNA hydrolase
MDLLVVGLGNPGAEYEGTRHNIGADAVTLLVTRHHGSLSTEKGLFARAAQIRIGDHPVLCAIPVTYMNESGRAVAPLVRRAGIDGPGGGSDGPGGFGSDGPGGFGSRLVVVHDEMDLPSGRVRVKVGGGTAGNNGLKSIHAHLHTGDYLRVRIGIGKPPGRQPGADYVLKRPGSAERETLHIAAELAADAVELIATAGVETAMNRINATE